MIRWLMVLTTLAACVPAPAAAAEALPVEERAFVASTLYAAVRQDFAHMATGVDLDQAYRGYLHEALAAPDRRAFDLASVAFLASFKNGHTYFYDRWLDAHDAGPLGFKLEQRPEGFVVTDSERDGLKPGDVVKALDGQSIETFVANQTRFLSASSDRARPYQLFAGWQSYLFPARFTLALAGGRRVAIDRAARLAGHPAARTAARWLVPGKVAYMKIPSFHEPGFEADALSLLPAYDHAAALVIDLRGNDGGAWPPRLTSALMDRPYRVMGFTTPLHAGLEEAYESEEASLEGAVTSLGWRSPRYTPKPDAFRGKLYLLTDGWCYSACESFLAPFKDNHRAVLVGDRTQGSTGQTYQHELANGMGFQIGAKRATMPDGSPFEGVGIAPDVPVTPTRNDLARGNDVALQRARSLAERGAGG